MKQAAPEFSDAAYLTEFISKFGAGEANRTPDPNLGKVMLYP